jgi:uncharacterized protein (TIGR02145 family)
VNDPRGLAPIGWHIPSEGEWDLLINLFGGYNVAGDGLKSNTGWFRSLLGGMNGSNSTGFTGIPGGYRTEDGSFRDFGSFGFWWSSYSFNPTLGFFRRLNMWDNTIYQDLFSKKCGMSVRIVKD